MLISLTKIPRCVRKSRRLRMSSTMSRVIVYGILRIRWDDLVDNCESLLTPLRLMTSRNSLVITSERSLGCC